MDSSILLMGILTIVVFLIVDTFAGQKKALIGVMLMTTIMVAFLLIKFGTIDKLTLTSIGILALFVSLSLWKKNDVFFKIQGPVINLVMVLMIWSAALFQDKTLLLEIFEKYMSLEEIAAKIPMMTAELLRSRLITLNFHMPFWLLIHAAITAWAAFKWNKWVWASIRVFGIYIISFIGMMIAIIITEV